MLTHRPIILGRVFAIDLRGVDRERPRGAAARALRLAEALPREAPDLFAAWPAGAPPEATTLVLQPAGPAPCPLPIAPVLPGLEAFLGGALSGLPARLRLGLLARQAPVLLAQSPVAAEVLTRYARQPASSIATLPPLPPAFTRSTREESEAVGARLGLPPRYLLVLGSLLKRRRLGFLTRAWAAAREQLDAGVGLVVAGEPIEERPPDGAGITFTGYVAPQLLPGLLSGAHAWFCAGDRELDPLGVLDAIACSVPAVVAKGSAHALAARGACVALDPDDSGVWTAAMVVLTRSAGERAKLAAACRARLAELSGSSAASELATSLEAALGRRSRPR